MEICFVLPTLASGGSERVVSVLSNYWAQKEHHITIIVLDKTQFKPFYHLSENINFESIDLFRKPKSFFKKAAVTFKQICSLRKKLKQIQPETIISFIDITSLLAINAAFFLGIKLIVSERSNPMKKDVNPILKNVNRLFFFRFADRIVLQTEHVKKYYPKSYEKKVTIIPNPVTAPPIDYIKSQETEFRRVVSVGRLEYPKGQDILLKAFANINNHYPNWKLTLVGDGNLKNELQSLCNEFQITKQVEWLGRMDNVWEVLSESDIFVFPSRYEGFPNALCEAMACGLAVISTDCPFGPSELITNNVNGILVPVEDERALSREISKLIENRKLRKDLGQQARNIVNNYSLNKIAQRWEHLIKEL